ncbi:MAG: chemotaxis protein CheA [Gemmatimonadales bacterium]|nr:chemotaxis protein CheA [Gemmatimonadota bacterium]MCL4212813.1 chemotaxis protein CheA [Gemmatimonadales bacterium]
MDPSRYADLFRTESRDQLSAINAALLALEQGETSREPVDAIFRGVHTIKGMSATMGYAAVAEFSHELESLLDKVRSGDQGLTPDLMDALFAAADALEAGVDAASESAALTPAMRRALERLHDVAGGRSTAEFRVMRPSDAATSAAELAAAAAVALQAALEGPGTHVQVVQSAAALLPGVRAFMAVQRLRELGEVHAVSPTVEQLQASTTPQIFRVRLETSAGDAEIERAVRSAGDVESVSIERREPRPAPEGAAGVAGAAGTGVVEDRRTTAGRRATDVPRAVDEFGQPVERREAPRARHVRIELSRLDALLNLIGELVIVRGRLQRETRGVPLPALHEAVADAARLIGDLQTEIMTSRLVPVGQVFDRFPRLVRDTARALGKDVLFSIEGKEIELDRSVLDEIGEPVVHCLRNAVDHGLELPEVREAAGKPRAGRLILAAQRDRAAVVISVRDDGRGIDRDRVLKRALALGMVPPGTVVLDDDAMLRCISHPGFSTAESVTGVSGRGVGIDAVQARTRALGGTFEVSTVPGEGTTVTIRLPVTLAIVRALLARVGNEHYALPLAHVRETMAHGPAEIRQVQGRDVLVLRDEVLPMLRLRDVVQLPEAAAALAEEIVVIERGDRRAGLVVDELTGQEDIVVKSFDAVRDGATLFSGATILADGAPALIVDVGSLL